MRVLLLNPPASGFFIREGRCMNRQEAYGSVWPPLTLMYLSSILKLDGHDVLLMDGMVPGFDSEKIVEFSPQLTVVNTSTPTIASDLEAARAVKEKTGSKTAVFGVHVTGTHKDMMRGNPWVDFAIRGEPEYTVRELASSLKNPSKVAGITFRRGEKGGLVVNRDRPYIRELDGLPMPDRDAVDNSLYTLPFTKRPFTMVLTGRGCPYHCSFCTVDMYSNSSFRTRSPPKVAREVKYVVEKYGIRDFMFYADEFTLDNKWVTELCGLLKPMGIRWFTNSRADTVNGKLLETMAGSGCWLLSFGIESASQEILDGVNKKLKVERVREAVASARRAGIKTIGHFIFGLPGESEQSAMKTIDFAKEIGVDFAQFYIAVPYPGTAFHKHCEKNDMIVSGDWSKYEINNAVIRTESLGPEQLIEIKRTANRAFYLRPGYLLRRLAEVRSLSEMKNLVRQGVEFFWGWAFSRR